MVYPTGRVSAEDGVIVQDEEEEARVMDGAQVPTAKGKKGKKK